MKATILGCGYVGKEVARLWQGQGITVTATTTRPDRLAELSAIADRAVVLTGNDAAALTPCLSDQQVLLISVGAKRGSSYEQTYLETARTLAQVLPHTAVQHLIYTSTYSVYGQHQGAWVTEATPVVPASENGKIIAAAEQVYLAAAQPNLTVCILRLGGIYGPGRELVKIFSRAAGTTRPGTGQEASNWVHQDDIVAAIEFAREQQLSGLYNLIQDQIPTVKDLIAQVCQVHNLEPVTWDATQPSGRPYNARVSNQKLKAAGYQFIHPTFEWD
jgi:nucleoside-diphosphate-sugar epimerase